MAVDYQSYSYLEIAEIIRRLGAVDEEYSQERSRSNEGRRVQRTVLGFYHNILTQFKQACDTLQIHEVVTVFLFKEVISNLALATIKLRVTLLWNENNWHKATIMAFDAVLNHLLKRYTTSDIIVNADEKVQKLKRSLSTSCGSS